MSRLRDSIRRFRKVFDEYAEGFRRGEFRRLFDRDAAEAYRVLTRDSTTPEPDDGFERFFHRVGLVFVGITSRLSPGRRALFLVSLLFLLLSFLDVGFHTEAEAGTWSLSIDFSPLWAAASFGSLGFLLVLELVDRVRVRDELEVARQLQIDLLPRGAPEMPGYRVAHSYRTANEVGGDYYDFQPLPDGRVALVVGDASGHGIAAGLVMAIANATLKTALDLDPAGANVHAVLNRTLCRTGDRRTFMSLFYALLTPASGRLRYVCAGHPYPLLRRAGGEVLELGTGSLPLGIKEPLEAVTREVEMAPGDLLVLYSDGLPEAVDGAGQAFGFERLAGLLAAPGSPQEVHDRILAGFDRHVGEEPLKDDLTLVVLLRDPAPPAPPPPLPPGS